MTEHAYELEVMLPGRRSLRICVSRAGLMVRPRSRPRKVLNWPGSCMLLKSSGTSG